MIFYKMCNIAYNTDLPSIIFKVSNWLDYNTTDYSYFIEILSDKMEDKKSFVLLFGAAFTNLIYYC